MQGKGVVVCTFEKPRRRHEAALRLRGGTLHNISTRLWDGRHVPGKVGSYDGVVLDAVCSAVGSWRRHPDARWTVTAAQIPELAAQQLKSIGAASEGVRVGGTLVYTVATVTRSETVAVVQAFLKGHPAFELEPFPHPLDGDTTNGMVQIWPQAHDCEARFIARMVRRAGPKATVSSRTVTEPIDEREHDAGE
jgi:16S rRNA (cytosine967-C5)-methyltransferase